MSHSSADMMILFFFVFFVEVINCGEHLKDLLSDSWGVLEMEESCGFTLLFILSYLGKPRRCMRAVVYQGREFSLQWVCLLLSLFLQLCG